VILVIKHQNYADTDTAPGRGVRPLGDNDEFRKGWNAWRLTSKSVSPGNTCKQWALEVLGDWRYVSPAKRLGSVMHLAPRDLCQVMVL